MTDADRFRQELTAALGRDGEQKDHMSPDAEAHDSTGPEPPEPLDADARRIAEAVLRDPDAAVLLSGDTAEELLRDAHRVSKALTQAAEKKAPPVDWDGGVREPAPAPADPAREHDQTVLEVVQRAKWEARGEGRRLPKSQSPDSDRGP